MQCWKLNIHIMLVFHHLTNMYQVIPNSPASLANVLPDDILVEFDGEAVKSCLQVCSHSIFFIRRDKRNSLSVRPRK